MTSVASLVFTAAAVILIGIAVLALGRRGRHHDAAVVCTVAALLAATATVLAITGAPR